MTGEDKFDGFFDYVEKYYIGANQKDPVFPVRFWNYYEQIITEECRRQVKFSNTPTESIFSLMAIFLKMVFIIFYFIEETPGDERMARCYSKDYGI